MLGNERITDSNGNQIYYPYQSSIGFNNILFNQGGKIISSQGAAQSKYAIRDISWETTESIDIGLDASFLNNRLRFSGDYFYKTTKDMLLALEIPSYVDIAIRKRILERCSRKDMNSKLGGAIR